MNPSLAQEKDAIKKQMNEERKKKREEEEKKKKEEEEEVDMEGYESDHHGRIFIDYTAPQPSVFPVSYPLILWGTAMTVTLQTVTV